MTGPLRLAIVVPRYGASTGGGAESLARWHANWLARRHDVTVLTTRAEDYRTWEDVLPGGFSRDGDVGIERFSVPEPRVPERFNRWHGAAVSGRLGMSGLVRWMREQGPNAPGLLEHLDRHGAGYDAVVFVPYLYATTWDGLPLVADRALMIPALHDEPPAAFPIMDRTFRLARGLAFSTPEERDFCRTRFGRLHARSRIVGIGVEPPPEVSPHRDDEPYVLYLGRVDPSKGCVDLLRAHRRAIVSRPDTPRLVLAGHIAMELPKGRWLEARGFVDEAEKHALLAGTAALILPSPYESLSMAVLEAWTHRRPVLVSARSPVLVGQVRRAGGGLWFADDPEYAEGLWRLLDDPGLAARLGIQGRRYALGRFRPEAVSGRLEGLLREVVARRRVAA